MNAQSENLNEVKLKLKKQRIIIAALLSAIIGIFILYVFI